MLVSFKAIGRNIRAARTALEQSEYPFCAVFPGSLSGLPKKYTRFPPCV